MVKDGNLKELAKLRREKKFAETKGRIKEQAEYCNAIGLLLLNSGEFDDALEEHQQELALCQALGDSIGEGVAHRKMGEVYYELGRPEQALSHHRRFLEAAEQQNDRLEIQRATATVGRTYLLMADNFSSSQDASKDDLLGLARTFFQKSLQAVPSVTGVSDREKAAMTARLHLNLGIVAESSGNIQQARADYKKAVTVTAQHSLFEDGRRVHDSLALSLQSTGEYRQALHHLETSLRLAERLQDRAARADTLHSRAQVLLLMEDMDGACRAWYKAYKLQSPRAADHSRHARCLRYAVRICRTDDQLLLMAQDDHQGRHDRHEKLGDWFCQLSAYQLALTQYRAQLECAEALGRADSAKAAIYASLAQTHKDLRQHAEAKSWFVRELEARQGNATEVCKTLMSLASLEASMGGGVSSVCEWYRQAAVEAGLAGLSRLRASALRDMADTYHEHGLLEDEARVRRDLALALRSDRLTDDFGASASPLTPTAERPDEEEEEDSSSDDEPLDLDELEGLSSDPEEANDPARTRRSRPARTLWRNNKGETHLHVACIQGKHKQVARLLQSGHPVNVRDHSGWLPLHEAANFGHLAAVRLLLERGARVSDPGGRHCGGVTPLHDAAGNGHVAVVRALLAAGADPAARNQQGRSPLEYLMNYRAESAADLTRELLADIQQLEHEMKEALRKEGLPIPASPSVNLQQSPSVRTAKTSSAAADDDASESPVVPPAITVSDDEEDPTVAYRRAIRSVGHSAVTAPPTVRGGGRRSAPSGPRSGMVDEAEYQWLDEDVPTAAGRRRRRRRLSPLFASAGGSRRAVSPPAAGRTRPISPLADGAEADADALPVAESPPPAGDDSESRLGDSSQASGPGPDSPPPPRALESDSELEIESGPSDGAETPPQPPSARRSRKRPRQTRLTPLLMRGQQRETAPPPDEPMSCSPSPSPTLPPKVHRTMPAAADTEAWSATTLRVFVEVEKDRLMVPVPVSNSADDPPRTVDWLANQASDRYYRQFLLRPRLELLKDGALLTLDDAVTGLVRGQDDVIGSRVISWERPPLTERYSSACQLLNDRVIGTVTSRLSLCQSSGRLDLADLCLTAARLRPVLRSTQRYSCITQLTLAGNPLKDDGIQELSTALPHLSGLESLDLTCVKMTTVGLSHLASAVSQHGALQECSTLRLGYNLLSDCAAGAHLATLVSHLRRLVCLDLSSCHLTERHLSAHGDTLTHALANCSLAELRLPYNRVSSGGTELLLRALRPDWLLRVSLAGWRGVPAALRAYAARGRDCSLQELDLRHCGLTDEHADQLASGLADTPHLARLDLSQNGRVSAAGVSALLSAALSAGCPLTQLCLAGCGAAAGPPPPLCDLLGRLLAGAAPLQRVTLPGGDRPEVLRRLSAVWTQRWAGRAAVRTSPDGDVLLELCDA